MNWKYSIVETKGFLFLFLNCAIETVYTKECILYITIVNIAGVRKWKYVVLGELSKIKIISWS